MPKMTIQEARELGLLSPEEIAAIGYNPFTPRAGASWTPNLGIRPGLNSSSFFRYPGLYQRPGISSLRFGLGGLGQGLTLSPESPALGLGGIAAPVGRSSARPPSYGVAGGVAGGIAGGVAGGRAGIGAEGSGNLLPMMILPDGRRLVRMPDGRAFIVGGPRRMVSAEEPEGLAALQTMGLISQGVGAVKQLADLISKIPGGTPGGTPGGMPGGVPGGAPGGVVEEGPGAGLVRPASLQQGPATPADALLPPDYLEGLSPEDLAALGELGMNTDLRGPAALGGPLAPMAPPDMAKFGPGPGTTFEMPGAGAGKPGLVSPDPLDLSGLNGPSVAGDVVQQGPWTGQPEMFPGGILGDNPAGKPGLPADDLSLSPAFYAPGGTGFNALDPETRRLYALGLTPEQIMGMMPAPAAGRADTAPRGLGPSPDDIFAPEPSGPGVTTNFDLQNTLGLGQNLLGVGQGAIGAGITGDPTQLVAALLKTGLSANQIARIPGLNQAGIGAGLGGALGVLNAIQAARSGNITGAIGGGLGTVGSAANLVASSPALQGAFGVGSTAAGATGAIAGGAGGLLSLASGIQGLIAGGVSPMQSALQMAGGLTGTYGAIASLSAMYPTLFGTVLPSLSSLAGSGLTAAGLPGVASALGLGGAAAVAAANSAALATPAVAAALGVVPGAAGTAGSAGAAGAGASAAAGPLAMIAVPYILGSVLNMVSESQHATSLKQAATRLKGLASSIPGHIAELQKAPGLLARAQQTADPQEAAAIFEELRQIEDRFDSTGMEDFLQAGMTFVAGGRDLGSGASASMPADQVKKINETIKPFLQALTYGRLVAQDKAQAAGIKVPGALSSQEYAMALGDTGFQEALRPSSTNRGSQLARYLGTNTNFAGPADPGGAGYGALDGADASAGAPFWAEVASPELLAFAGLPTEGYAKMNYSAQDLRNTLLPGGAMHGKLDPALVDSLGPARVQEMLGLGKAVPTVGDIRNRLSAGGAGKGRADEFGGTSYGFAHMATLKELGTLKPGQYEQGLRELLSKGGWGSNNPLFTAAGQPAPATPSGSMAFDPLKFLSSLEAGERAQIQSGPDTLTFVPYKPAQSQMFQAPDSGYQQIGEGFYAKSSGQAGGAEIYLPQDRASELGKALAGYQASPVAGQVGALLAPPVPSGQEAGATPGAGPAGDIAPEAVAAGTSSTEQPTGTVAPPPDATQPVPGAGFKKGGVVPKTGEYTLHAGELVVPANQADEILDPAKDMEDEGRLEETLQDMRKRGQLNLGGPAPLKMPKPGPSWRSPDPTMPDEARAVGGVRLAHHEESETVQDEDTGKWVNVYGRNIKGKAGQRLPDSGEYDTVEEAEEAAKARSEAEGQKGSAKPPKVKGWYVHIKEGVPSQDLDGNDPMVRRLAFTPDEVEQALEAGEAPIMVGKGVLALPPSAIRGFLQNAQNMQNKDPMKHPAMVAMGNRIRQAQSMQPEGDTLPYPGLGAKILRGNQPRFKGDRGRGADKPLDSVGRESEIGGGLTGPDDTFRNMDVLPKAMPEMPSIYDGSPEPTGPLQVRGLGGPGIARAMRLAQGPAEDFARQDRMLEGIDRGTIAPSTLGGASREQRRNLTPEDIMGRPSKPGVPQPQPGLLEQFRRRVTG